MKIQRFPNEIQRFPNEIQRFPKEIQRFPNEIQRFPNEIYEIILSYVFDVEDISNCRKTCSLFNNVLSSRCVKISENRKRDFNNPFPRLSRHKNLNLDFLFSFEKIKYLDFPIFVNHKIFKTISKLDLQRLTIRTDDIISILCCIDKHINENKSIKIIQDKNIYWLKEGFFGKLNGNYNFADELLMDICRCKKVISNKYISCIRDVEKFIYLCSLDKINSLDYYPPLCLKKFSWRPVLSEDRRNINYISEISKCIQNIKEVRPKIIHYEMPVLKENLEDMKKVFINARKYSFIEKDKMYFSYNNNYIDLNKNLKEPEEYIDDYFGFI